MYYGKLCPPDPQIPTGSSSSSWRENVERRDMLDSECNERIEMAESDRRVIGGWREKEREGGERGGERGGEI